MRKLMKTNSTLAEEIVNSILHGLAALAAAVAGVLLLHHIWNKYDAGRTAGYVVYIATFILLYLTSTLYHALFFTRAKKVFRLLDHSVIYLFIAGSYTPFVLSMFPRSQATLLITFIWFMAAVGILFQVFKMNKNLFSILTYMAFGLFSLLFLKHFLTRMPFAVNLLLSVGGALYLIGVIFYAWKKLYMNHGIWHVFVIAGSFCHFFALLFVR